MRGSVGRVEPLLKRRLLEEQDKGFRCYYAAKWGGQKEWGEGGPGEETGQMHLGGEQKDRHCLPMDRPGLGPWFDPHRGQKTEHVSLEPRGERRKDKLASY